MKPTTNNLAIYRHGGAIFTIYSAFTLNGSKNFVGNSANGNGGAIFAVFSRPLSFAGSSSFYSNSAVHWSHLCKL